MGTLFHKPRNQGEVKRPPPRFCWRRAVIDRSSLPAGTHLCTDKQRTQARRSWGGSSFGHDRDCPGNGVKTWSHLLCWERMVLGDGAPLRHLAWYGAVSRKGPEKPFRGLPVSCRIALLPLRTSSKSRKGKTMASAGCSLTSVFMQGHGHVWLNKGANWRARQ